MTTGDPIGPGIRKARGLTMLSASLTLFILLGECSKPVELSSNKPPTANATATPTSGPAPLAVTFSGAGSDPDGYWLAYVWDFGDGITTKEKDATHTYIKAGIYTATFTVIDGDLAEAKTTLTLPP